MSVFLAVLFMAIGCATVPTPQTLTLRCNYPWESSGFMGIHSFAAGELKPPISPTDEVDIMYYFDNDDCAQGAIIGYDDHAEYLFPIGHKSWRELSKLERPSKDAQSVVGIAPLTKDKEGLAFWVKTERGEFILARIKTLHPASYADLVAGTVPTVELEWYRPKTLTGK